MINHGQFSKGGVIVSVFCCEVRCVYGKNCKMAAASRFKKRKLKVFDDDIVVVSARTNKTVAKFSPRTVLFSGKKYAKENIDSITDGDVVGGLGLANVSNEGHEVVNLEVPGLSARKTAYQVQQENTHEQWTQKRDELLTAAIGNSGMPNDQRCNEQEFSPFMEQPIPLLKFSPAIQHGTSCTRSVRSVTVVDYHGRQHLANIELCSCQSDVTFFVQHRLWPASPNKPELGFMFTFLDMIENLLLENQISLKGFCDGIKETLPRLIKNNGKDIYRALKSQTFAEYRYFNHQIRTLQVLCPSLSPGNICPSCPKDCSKFNAGSAAAENLNRNRFFDIKAVFGSVCRHEFPLKFLNLKHGERIAYPVMLIKEHLEEIVKKPELYLHVSYDIACILKRHLESSKQESLLNKFSLSLPAFHTYAHRPSCQVLFGARYCDNVGLTDGEQCERLWSYLRCFSAITKEMTEANRQDVLTDALLYYSRKKIEKLPALLCKRLERAQKLAAESEKSLKNLQQTPPFTFSLDDVAQWVHDQRSEALLTTVRPADNTISWQKEYIRKILDNRQLRQSLMTEELEKEMVTENLQKDLKAFERKYKIRHRWDFGSDVVGSLVIEVVEEERKEILRNLQVLAFERSFLIGLKRKYADGQKLAKTISKNIKQKVTAMEKLLKPFNKNIAYLQKYIPEIKSGLIDRAAAFDLDSELYSDQDSTDKDARLPSCIKVKAVNLFLTMQRALEEIDIICKDAQNTVNFLLAEVQKLKNAIQTFNGTTSYISGARSLLYGQLTALMFFTARTILLFQQPNSFRDMLDINLETFMLEVQERNAAVMNVQELSCEFDEDDENEHNQDIEEPSILENIIGNDEDFFQY
eukprot:gene768-60_t